MSFFGKAGDAVLETLGVVAPVLATALGGPLAGAAVHTIGRQLLGNDDATEDEVRNAIRMASTDDLIALKNIEKEFALKMKQAGVRLEEIDAGDRDSARRRQVAMRDWSPSVLGVLIITGFFGLLGLLMYITLPDGTSDIFKIMIGALAAMTTQVCNYFFGSSRGSARKNDTIERLKAEGNA